MFDYIKEQFFVLIKSRIFVLTCFFCLLFLILIGQCFNLQIINGANYQEQYTLLIQKTKEVTGTRGNIYDRNGVLLAYNELAYAVTIEDNGSYSSTAEKNKILNDVILRVISAVESNEDHIINTFKITLNERGEYEYVNSVGTARNRFIADVYGESYIDDLSTEQLNSRAIDLVEYLCTDKTYGYGIEISDDPVERSQMLKLINVRYAMSLNSYRKYIATTIAEDVSAKTVAIIMENSNELQGVNIEENSLRRYVDSEYFAPILGYTGVISKEEYDVYVEEGIDTYSLTDMVGKSGIEKEMELELQGTKGEEKVYVNSVGKVIDSVSTTEATVGNDVYLTIDSDLQKVAYDLLEEQLAGILISKLNSNLKISNWDHITSENITIPIGSVYNAFFANQILDVSNFQLADTTVLQKSVYDKYMDEYNGITTELLEYIQNSKGSIRDDLTSAMGSYVTHVTASILKNDSEIIMNSKVDTSDDTYKAWATYGTINAYTYINYAISQNWIDTTKLKASLGDDSIYSDSNEIFESIVKYVKQQLLNDQTYENLIYGNMITDGKITGREICMIALEQEVFTYSSTDYNNLSSNKISAYSYLRGKISNLELTPGQLGLEPSSGSVVITDPENGDVLALVSYPGYDNNRLANTIDSAYYNKLVNDLSSPFYNHATQEKTAPGSTFKMITLAAGITEEVSTNGTVLYCNSIYEKVSPNPKCWCYPYSHGMVNPSTSLRDSCNNYFYEIGYRLSLRDRTLIGTDDKLGSTTADYYSSNLGTEALKQYASLFGLDEKTGIEIPESNPEISDESSVPSAIGQGTHNYTTTQLARYVATVANKGTVHNLTLLDRVEDINDNLVTEFESEARNPITVISDTTWNTIHTGMTMMVNSSSTFNDLGDNISLAGKTGTAQQSKKNANHALFVGFTPVNNPEIAFAIRIANGYNSGYAAQIGMHITNYYSGVVDKEDIINGEASNLATVIAGD